MRSKLDFILPLSDTSAGLLQVGGKGTSLEQGNKASTRPLTEEERKRQKWGVVVGLVVMLLAIAGVLIMILFLQGK